MIDELCTKPLLNLLRDAMTSGIITGWSVDGKNVILYQPGKRAEVLPLEAGMMLREWLQPHAGAAKALSTSDRGI